MTPDWAQPMFPEANQWTRFVELTLAAAQVRDPGAQLHESGEAVALTLDGNKLVMGFYNLARFCTMRAEPADWPEVIDAWVARVERTQAQGPSDTSWEAVAPQLRVQLYNDNRLAEVPASVLRKLCDDLWLGVVIDTEETMISVIRSMLDGWGKTEDELFERARANLEAAEIVVDMNDSHAPLLFGNSADDYGAIAVLERIPELLEDFAAGALVSFPLRTASFVLPLATKPDGNLVQKLVSITQFFFREQPGTQISPNLFWWSRGQLERVPYATEHGMIVMMMPDHIRQYVMS